MRIESAIETKIALSFSRHPSSQLFRGAGIDFSLRPTNGREARAPNTLYPRLLRLLLGYLLVQPTSNDNGYRPTRRVVSEKKCFLGVC